MKLSTLLLVLPFAAATAQVTPAPAAPAVPATPAAPSTAPTPMAWKPLPADASWELAKPLAPEAPLAISPDHDLEFTPLAWSSDRFKFPQVDQRFPQDPADSTYREARSLLNRGEWRRAAQMFSGVASRTPASSYAADALYWQAFALYRLGGTQDLKDAVAALDSRKSRFPGARNNEEAESLYTRVNGALAARGDQAARDRLRSRVQADAAAGCDAEDLSVRASALSTLMRNDPDAAMPILVKVLDRRDECTVPLRKNAVTIIGSKGDAAAKAKLMDVIANDPNTSVRSDAIGYAAQVNTDAVANTLDNLIKNTGTDLQLQRSAVRALGTMTAPAAKTAIRALVERQSAPERLRLDAIQSFDRRAGYTMLYCGDGDCTPRAINTVSGQYAYTLSGDAVAVPPRPPTPAVAPQAPMVPSLGTTRAAEARAEAQAAAEARAEARADAARAAQDVRVATTVNARPAIAYGQSGNLLRLDEDDRRITPEDATWLRGAYARLETTRLKSAAVAVLARATDDATKSWIANIVSREEEPAEVRSAILNRLGSELPITSLAKLYDNASGRTVRQEIVELLGRRPEAEATDKLIDIVRTGTDPQLRRAAISALNNKKDPRTTQLLLELIDK